MSSDLFAGLSLNPSASQGSPTKAKVASTTNGSTTTRNIPIITTPGKGGDSHPDNPRMEKEDSPFEALVGNFVVAPATMEVSTGTFTPVSGRITSAPATDKLLGLLGTPPSSPAHASQSAAAIAAAQLAPASPTTGNAAAAAAAADPKSPPTAAAPWTAPTSPPSSENKAVAEDVLMAFSMESQTVMPPSKDGSTASSQRTKPSLRGIGSVSDPIPQAAVALRLFQKFASKVQATIPESHGGTLRRGILGYLFGSSKVYDAKYDAYKSWSEAVQAEDANTAVACFCHLLGVWGHASAHMAEVESKTSTAYLEFARNLGAALDTATSLVTRGCLDGVEIESDTVRKSAVNVICEAVFASDLSQCRVELSAMKFLLSTGCRVYASPEGQQSMLRGTYLLQSIRVLYHVFLTTESNANKTTARASLQQLVTSVFIRMIAASSNMDVNADEIPHEAGDDSKVIDFPTEDHRDAFLVLRSLCKLSMRNPPNNMHSHVGLQAGNSNTTWDAQNMTTPASPSYTSGSTAEAQKPDVPALIFTQAIHPALESKILALELLLYVLQNTNMKGDSFVQRSGSQFHNAIRSYLCVSLLKNCTSDDTRVVSLSLQVFVPIIRNFRALLKTEIEAFVTNVFFVILDSKNSPMDHKNLVVTLFEEICSDPQTLAEIFLNYDCDLSAVDLFHRIVNTLAKVAQSMEIQTESNSILGSGTVRMEKTRTAHRQLRLEAMKALRQVLASLHGSIIKPMMGSEAKDHKETVPVEGGKDEAEPEVKKNLVEIYGSKKKKQEEESEIILRFNQRPSAGLAYAAKCGHVDGSDPNDVARFLLENKEKLDTTQIGEYLGREVDYQGGFAVKVLHGYANLMDFEGLVFDDAIRHYLSGFRLPGEAQKIDRIMEKFAERFTAQNPEVFPTADVAFILAFSIIMLNTDLHNPAIKEERRMTKEGFIRNNRGICDGQDLPSEMLLDIFDRIKNNPISLKEDDEARKKVGEGNSAATGLPSAISPAAFFSSYEDADRTKETNFSKERDQIVKTTESLLRRKRHTHSDAGKQGRRSRSSNPTSTPQHIRYVRTEDSGLRDEYVSPMFEVTWGPALAAFSTAMASANGYVGALFSIASDEELEAAAINAAETIEVCLAGFRFAICTAGLCGNDVARDAYMLALSRFSQLGTGSLLESRHIRCAQTILTLARYNGELLGSSWEHVFRALSEINRFHQLFQLLARHDKAIAVAAERRRARLQEREQRLRAWKARKAAKDNNEIIDDESMASLGESSGDLSQFDDSDLFSDSSDQDLRDDMNKKEIDEANAKLVYEAVSEGLIQAIYERSSSLSTATVKEFVHQLCRVSRMEISGNWQAGADVDLTSLQSRERRAVLNDDEGFHHHQTNIYSLQKLVEVTHYNMDSRPRLVFADIWTPVSEHLTTTALYSNPAVAMYAVDSFRQLSIQYLQREEPGAFEFQRRFLKPLEIVMSNSDEHTTKELLLKCVERLILMFGCPEDKGQRGMLRSGWRPILTVLGLAGRERDGEIAKLGFSMLSAQLEPIVAQKKGDRNGRGKLWHGILLDERFVEVVDALLSYVDGPHEELSTKALEHLFTLSSFLADDAFALPLIKRRGVSKIMSHEEAANVEVGSGPETDELELWWPILLGVSKAIGDARKLVRGKSLETLSKIILTHLFPTAASILDEQKKGRQIQLLQLVFRGILMPVLEFAEMEVSGSRPPALPSDFDRFLTGSKAGDGKAPQKPRESWLETTFDQFMDACIAICLKAGEAFGDDALLEEVFAMLNSCMISDSGALAVRGLRRLELLMTVDLKPNKIDDDTWATVSHMLRRSLAVRSLPKIKAVRSGSVDADGNDAESEQQAAIREFTMEDSILANRRYLGSNAVMVISSFLGSERFADSLELRWRIFLVSGVAKAIRDWEYASSIVDDKTNKARTPAGSDPYLETAFYSRKHMNRFLLQIAAKKEIAPVAADGSREAAAQALVKEQTLNLVSTFLKKESLIAANKASSLDLKLFERWAGLVRDMFAAYDMIPEEQLILMSWLDPALMPCIGTNTESIRSAIQRLTKKLHASQNLTERDKPPTSVPVETTSEAVVDTPSKPVEEAL